jgi:hypothetical protein
MLAKNSFARNWPLAHADPLLDIRIIRAMEKTSAQPQLKLSL